MKKKWLKDNGKLNERKKECKYRKRDAIKSSLKNRNEKRNTIREKNNEKENNVKMNNNVSNHSGRKTF